MKLHFHNWNKWSDPINTYNTGHKQQWTVCSVCNKAKFRTLWWDDQSGLNAILEAIRKAQE